jgi:hypothetical protein
LIEPGRPDSVGSVRYLATTVLTASIAIASCGGAGTGDINNEGDLRAMLDDLPYEYTLRPVRHPRAEQAYIGQLTGSEGRRLDFAISICDSDRLEEETKEYLEDAQDNEGIGPVRSLGCPTAPFPQGTGEGTVESFGEGAVSLRYPAERPSGISSALSDALCEATDSEGCDNG